MTARVRTAAFSPDGRRIVTASADQTARIWDADTAKQLDVLSGHGDGVWSAAFSPDGRRIVTASFDQTARIWDADTAKQLAVLSGHGDDVCVGCMVARWAAHRHRLRLTAPRASGTRPVACSSPSSPATAMASGRLRGRPMGGASSPPPPTRPCASGTRTCLADLDAQIAWSQAAKIDDLSDLERSRLGLPPDARIRTWSDDASECDTAAAAPHDPDRRAPGVAQGNISVSVAGNACAQEIAESGAAPRLAYQLGRALLAKDDLKGARREFELAVSGGYRAAQVDLAGLLVDASAGPSDHARAVSLYEKAWRDGVPIAAFELGQLYERGVPGAAETAPVARQPDLSKAWSWYRKGADIGEPNALARFGERDDASAVTESSPQKRDALLLKAFASYAAAAERAQVEDWPDDTWRNWRYRRATLARLLAREGMMSAGRGCLHGGARQGRRGHRHGWKNQAIPTDGSVSKE